MPAKGKKSAGRTKTIPVPPVPEVKSTTTKPIQKKKAKNVKKRKESFKIFIHRVMKDVHPDMRMSTRAMGIVNSFIIDMFERLASEASRLAKYSRRPTLNSRDVQTAVRLILPGELSRHAVSEGTKAVAKYTSSI